MMIAVSAQPLAIIMVTLVGLLAGMAFAWMFFASLRWVVQLYLERRALKGCAVQFLRVTLTVGLLTIIAGNAGPSVGIWIVPFLIGFAVMRHLMARPAFVERSS